MHVQSSLGSFMTLVGHKNGGVGELQYVPSLSTRSRYSRYVLVNYFEVFCKVAETSLVKQFSYRIIRFLNLFGRRRLLKHRRDVHTDGRGIDEYCTRTAFLPGFDISHSDNIIKKCSLLLGRYRHEKKTTAEIEKRTQNVKAYLSYLV